MSSPKYAPQSPAFLKSRYSSTFATFQSEFELNNTNNESQYSSSDESDDDFGGYSFTKHIKSLTKTFTKNMRPKKYPKTPKTKKVSNASPTVSDFDNFKIRSLTIISMDSDDGIVFDADPEAEHHDIHLDLLFEEKAITNNDEINHQSTFSDDYLNMMMNDVKSLKIKKPHETNTIYDDHVIAQLQVFGYKRKDIIQSMDCAHDITDINEIKKILDGYKIKRLSAVKRNTKRTFIEKEIIATEKSYYEGLRTLLNELIQPIFDNGYVDKKYYDEVRSSLPQIAQFHGVFLEELNEVFLNKDNEKQQSLASVFNTYFTQHKDTFMDIYTEFIKDYEEILDLFGSTFHGNAALDEFLKSKRKERKPLTSMLILPVQRVPRYILLLADLRKNTEETSDDYKDIVAAVEMIQDITEGINEKKRQIENLSTCLHIQEELNGLKEPIIRDDREFVEEFVFIKKEINHQRLFFLFNDIVIIANAKWNVKHILEVITLDVKIKNTSKKELPEFELVSGTAGSAVYIGKDMKTITKFQKLIGKCRIENMGGRLTQRLNTLGSFRNILEQLSKKFDD